LILGQTFPKAGELVRWGGGAGGEELWSRARSGVHAVGDVDGDGVDDVVAGTIRFHGIVPPYSVDGVDGSNSLLWSYPLGAIYDESGFAAPRLLLNAPKGVECGQGFERQVTAPLASGLFPYVWIKFAPRPDRIPRAFGRLVIDLVIQVYLQIVPE
jgi:hypothetical protein